MELLTNPVGHMLRQIVDERKELVGHHDDHDAQDDEHGDGAGEANDFGLRGSGNEHLKARPDHTAKDVEQNHGGEESSHHERRANDDAEQQKITAFAVLPGGSFSFGQGVGA